MTAAEIIENVKENRRKLASCKGPHDFSIVDGIISRTCTICGGWTSTVSAIWYKRGLADANKTKDDQC